MALAGCGDPEIVVPEVLSVDFYPPHGSVQIALDVQGLLEFTHEVADPDDAASKIALACLGTPAPTCATPELTGCPATTSAAVTFAPGSMEARVTPATALANNTCYVFTVEVGIEAKAKNVGALPSPRRSAFQTL